jgi:hypothetical protein
MTQIFGDFEEHLTKSQEYLTIVFSPSSAPLRQRWRTSGLSADFMADYLATFLFTPETTPENDRLKSDVKSTVCFIANELLENAMKFNDESSQQPISLTLEMHGDRLVFLATNSIKSQGIEKLQGFIQNLISHDPMELYMKQLESDDEYTSGLGFLTMLNDYHAKLGWRFDLVPSQPEITTVTTMVQVTP